jgi:hypothetical protein
MASLSPPRLAVLDGMLDRQVDHLGVNPRAEAPSDFLPDRLGIATDSGGEVPAPGVIKSSDLDEPGGFAVGDAVAKSRHEVVGEVVQHPLIITSLSESDQVYTGPPADGSASPAGATRPSAVTALR